MRIENGQSRIIVALDFPTVQEAIQVARTVGPCVWGFKVGLGFIHSELGGHNVTSTVQAWAGNNAFYDCKLFDAPSQVERAVRSLGPLGIRMFTVCCLGGKEMMVAAKQASIERAQELLLEPPLVLGVTVPTWLDFNDLLEMDEVCPHAPYPISFTPEKIIEVNAEMVRQKAVLLAKLAKEAGLDGVIASVQEAQAIRKVCGTDFLVVTPGIRSADAPPDDQKRTCTAREAIDAGADLLVIGRPITQAADVLVAVKEFNVEIEAALAHKASVIRHTICDCGNPNCTGGCEESGLPPDARKGPTDRTNPPGRAIPINAPVRRPHHDRDSGDHCLDCGELLFEDGRCPRCDC